MIRLLAISEKVGAPASELLVAPKFIIKVIWKLADTVPLHADTALLPFFHPRHLLADTLVSHQPGRDLIGYADWKNTFSV